MTCTFVAVVELEDIVSVVSVVSVESVESVENVEDVENVEEFENVEDVEGVEDVEDIAVYDLVVDDNAVHYLIMDLMMLNHERVGIQRLSSAPSPVTPSLSVEPNYYYYESNKDENYKEHVKEQQK
jgi:hypothetical protein